MARIWREPEISADAVRNCTVAVLGYGSQGRAQAANLRDSGVRVVVGARQGGTSLTDAAADGFQVLPYAQAARESDIIALLLPESAHESVLESEVLPALREESTLIFAHGYTVVYGPVRPRSGTRVLLVAPKAIGPQLRSLYQSGSGAAALVAADGGDLALAMSYACALGCGRTAVIESTFREETETDLFSEQVLLCGGMPALANAAFDVLVDAGYSPEAAYFECLFEVKLIADLMFESGIAGMVDRISDTAQFGAMTAGDRVVDERVVAAMKQVLAEIRSGDFARNMESQRKNDMRDVVAWRQSLRARRIEAAHAALKPK